MSVSSKVLFNLQVDMGGLGNGRRGGRSPPLLIGALIACILVLGFNYWVSSSRNLELQVGQDPKKKPFLKFLFMFKSLVSVDQSSHLHKFHQ